MPRSLLTLCLSQGVGAIGLAAGAAAGPLLAEEIGGSAAHGPAAMGALVVGSGLSGPAAAALMRRFGRVPGLAVCYLTAALGALIVVLSLSWGYAALLAGSVLLGAGTTAAMLGRFLAADLVEDGRQAQAMGRAVGSLTVGAVAGPVLLGPSGALAEAFGFDRLTGLHLIAMVVFPLAALICVPLHATSRRAGSARADRESAEDAAEEAPADKRTQTGSPASAGRWRQSRWLPLAVLATGNISMVGIMGAAPGHLHHHGWDLNAVGFLMAAHIGGMFALSPVSAALCRRLGARQTSVLAAVAMVLTLLLGVSGLGRASDVLLVFLAGAAWNMHLVSGSAWLVEVTPRPLRHRTEGLGELAMGATAAVGTFALAGPLLAAGGLAAMCAALAVVNAGAGALFWLSLRSGPPRLPDPESREVAPVTSGAEPQHVPPR
ncbi:MULTISPECIES: MFS transporter [Streptomyces]|uniref:MFS transporter n=1 Tax=Streptomyces TaxID=1883 RepID=UPI001300A526|nr:MULTISPECIES: MFS transporter [Streptomyces]